MIATRAEALHRLETFLPHAGRDYASTRNYDRGPDDRTNVSKLSPYVRARALTEEELLRAVLARHAPSACEKFVQEVLWRTYWKGWLQSRPFVWTHYRRDLAAAAYASLDGERAAAFGDAIAGRTGNAAFDAWASELVTTGYLHNHARMWFASIWIFTLRLPWELGADFFMRHLYCGDPAANTLSWRWVAGLQTKGKTYLATRENIRRYTDGRLDPGPHLASEARPVDGPSYAPGRLPDLVLALPPDVPSLLLLHDDDTGVETLDLAGLDVRGSVALCAVSGRSPRTMAEQVVAFARDALDDALARAPHGDPHTIVDADDVAAAADAIAVRAAACGATRVVAPFAPVGPNADALDALRAPLRERGLALEFLGRRYDATVWPYATRGFFHLKDKIPSVLATLGAVRGRGGTSD
ncbi:MAG: hypothetical protein NVSMB21_24680 [Vulcanimicrobiaceae bacterium]